MNKILHYRKRGNHMVIGFIFGLASTMLQAQELEWAKQAGGTQNEEGNAIAVDTSGNSYVTGFFTGTATFGTGEVNETTLISAGTFPPDTADIFVAKYGNNGQLVWAKRAGGGNFEQAHGITVDAAGNSYLTGRFTDTATFGPGETNETNLISAGNEDIFVAKYDSDGQLIWAKRAGGSGSEPEIGFGIAVDTAGNSYVTGEFSGAATFGPGEVNETILIEAGGPSSNSVDVFVAKYDSDSQLVWAKKAGDLGPHRGRSIAVNASGNSYVTGYFSGTATFGAGEANETTLTSDAGEIFVAKYDANGLLVWAKQSHSNGVEGNSIAVDAAGNSYVTGRFQFTATFGPGETNETILTSNLVDIFVAKYDADGLLVWAKQSRSNGSEGSSIAVDAAGNSYVTGFFSGIATFGAGEANETILTPRGGEFDADIFVAMYGADGLLVGVKQAGGSEGNFQERAFSIAVDISGNSYLTGYFGGGTLSGSATFGPGEANETILTTAGDADIFVAKFGRKLPGQTFTDINANLTDVRIGSVAWGDYDNDEDLDILLAGLDISDNRISKVYRNDGDGVFTDINANLIGVCCDASASWGDYDNDGDLDILLIGVANDPVFEPVSKVYRNNGGEIFTDINANITAVFDGKAAWGDYDNDGDLDILQIGGDGVMRISKIYRNDDGGVFTDINASLTGVNIGSVAWGDYDNDGDLDILLTGYTGSGDITKVYRNDGDGAFTDINANLTSVESSSAAWGDYDNDGDLDILLTGFGVDGAISKVYRNDGGGVFTDVSAMLMGVHHGAGAWGDYDNDGDLDIVLTGLDFAFISLDITRVYRNDGGGFTDVNANLIDVEESSVAWGDYDNDGDLDVLLIGFVRINGYISKIYRNDDTVPNINPLPPSGLTATVQENSVVLKWQRATDTETPSPGLTYNLRLGTSSGGIDVVAPMSAPSGYQQVAALGNVNHDTTWTIKNLDKGTYYWSVQAIDNTFSGSAFAQEESFIVTNPIHVSQDENLLPLEYALHPSYPNPFNPSTVISYDLPQRSHVVLTIHNVLGQEVARLVDEKQNAGSYKVIWNPEGLASGVYFYQLKTEAFEESKKMILAR